jgi:hypothetical protein
MPNRHVLPPWEFLLSASRNSLQSYELSRLGHAANLRKEVAPMLDQWVEETASALLARWLLEHQGREAASASTNGAAASQAENANSASDNFFADSTRPQNGSRSAT